MKVVYMAKTPLAGVCEKMARAVNEYLKPHVEARVLNCGPGKHRWYCRKPKELVPHYSIKNPAAVEDCLRWGDVFHCMANVGIRSPFFDPYSPVRMLKKKRWVYQWHGAQIWPFELVFKPEDYPFVKFLHIGQGWVESTKEQAEFFAPFFERFGAETMPNIVMADDPLHRPKPWAERLDRVGFAPSQKNESAVNRKGIAVTRANMRGVKPDIIMGVPFEECLKRKSKCKLGIDEIVTPMYHLSALEFLCQGTPVICSYTDKTEEVLKDATGCDRMPFLNCSPDTLQIMLDGWRDLSEEEREAMGKDARAWIDEFYHPRQLIERYVEHYQS